jgi:arylsulfatase A-like enzyme
MRPRFSEARIHHAYAKSTTMIFSRSLVVIVVLTLTTTANNATAARPATRPPNVVLILTDNQSAGTLGCYGNPDIRTPHIDRVAREGMLFERCFASNAVCSPTRATLLTGLIPSQHGVHSYLTAGGAQMGPHAHNTIGEFHSLPEILAGAGYTCGLTGKWHLGDNLHPQEGFTTWITTPHGHTRTFHNADVIQNGRVRKEPQYLTEFWTDQAVKFIDENRGRPFFLLLAYNGPYGLGESMLDAETNRYTGYYSDKELNSFPRETMHPWQHGNKNLHNNITAMRRYAAEISAVDDGVGRILAALEAGKIEDDTLLIFTADQGLATGQNGLWAMGDHTRPLTAYDPMTHTPLIYHHPGRIRPGVRANLLVSNYDFLPTLLDYLAVDCPNFAPSALQNGDVLLSESSPGRTYLHTLQNKPDPNWDNTVFFEYETTRSIRTDAWKLITRFPNGPNELYDLKTDPNERRNLIDQPQHAAQQLDLRTSLEKFFTTYANPTYDLTRGGKSKAPRRVQ